MTSDQKLFTWKNESVMSYKCLCVIIICVILFSHPLHVYMFIYFFSVNLRLVPVFVVEPTFVNAQKDTSFRTATQRRNFTKVMISRQM